MVTETIISTETNIGNVICFIVESTHWRALIKCSYLWKLLDSMLRKAARDEVNAIINTVCRESQLIVKYIGIGFDRVHRIVVRGKGICSLKGYIWRQFRLLTRARLWAGTRNDLTLLHFVDVRIGGGSQITQLVSDDNEWNHHLLRSVAPVTLCSYSSKIPGISKRQLLTTILTACVWNVASR